MRIFLNLENLKGSFGMFGIFGNVREYCGIVGNMFMEFWGKLGIFRNSLEYLDVDR